jgi:hypothetical protein
LHFERQQWVLLHVQRAKAPTADQVRSQNPGMLNLAIKMEHACGKLSFTAGMFTNQQFGHRARL